MFIKKILEYLKLKDLAKFEISFWEDAQKKNQNMYLEHIPTEAKIRRKLYIRKHQFNEAFEWTQENTQKVIDLNDGLLKLYRRTYDEMLEIKKFLDAQIAAGNKDFEGYVISAGLNFHCPHGLSPAETAIWKKLSSATDRWGSCLFISHGDKYPKSFEEQMMIDNQSWCEYPFNVKELDDTYINFFMHDIFDHNETFSLADAVQMSADDFSCDISVRIEHKEDNVKFKKISEGALSLSRDDRVPFYNVFMFIKKILRDLKLRKQAKQFFKFEEKSEKSSYKLDRKNLSNKTKLRRKLFIRKRQLNEKFEWTPENTQKIIDLNNGLFELYRKAYDQMVEIKKDLDAKIEAGNTAYEKYVINMELDFTYPIKMAPDGDCDWEEERMWIDLKDNSERWGTRLTFCHDDDFRTSLEEMLMMDVQPVNQYPFDVKELSDTYIYYFMNDIFDHNETFSLEDAVKMKAEDFAYEITVNLEPNRNYAREY